METVIYEIRDKVAFVTINRPHAYNACDKPTYERLAEVWQDFAVDLSCRFSEGWGFANVSTLTWIRSR